MNNERDQSWAAVFRKAIPTTLTAVALVSCGGSEQNAELLVPTPACPYIDVKPGETASLGRFLVTNGLPSAEVQIIDGRTLSEFRIPALSLGEEVELPRDDVTVTFANDNHIFLEEGCEEQIF